MKSEVQGKKIALSEDSLLEVEKAQDIVRIALHGE